MAAQSARACRAARKEPKQQRHAMDSERLGSAVPTGGGGGGSIGDSGGAAHARGACGQPRGASIGRPNPKSQILESETRKN